MTEEEYHTIDATTFLLTTDLYSKKISYDLNFDSDEDITGIENVTDIHIGERDNNWYDLNGRKLQGKPMRRGVYLNNGRKISIY